MTALLLNPSLLGKPRQTPAPDKVVDAVLCYRPDVPRHSPSVRLPNMSFQVRNPEPHPARGLSIQRSQRSVVHLIAANVGEAKMRMMLKLTVPVEKGNQAFHGRIARQNR